MLRTIILFTLSAGVFLACSQTDEDSLQRNLTLNPPTASVAEFDSSGMNIESRYNVPVGFERIPADSNSFAYYLRKLPLKEANEEVTYYNGGKKKQGQVYRSVIDLPIGNKNLHQCADAVMRFRAEYLWSTKQHNAIHFNFTNGFRVDYSRWLEGNRMIVSGNKTYWSPGAARVNSYATFWKYMELIFNYAGTLSLDRELANRKISDMLIGDVFIQGGSPGHAVIVVDMCQNKETGEKQYLLAQSYMPAQETQVLLNPAETETSWYKLSENEMIRTPEWTFYASDLKHF